MAERRLLWEQAAAELFDTIRDPDITTSVNTRLRASSNIIKDLEKARISELKKWWEMTSLTKYMENDRVPRGLRILIVPTLGDMDPDLLEEWRSHTAACSRKLIGTLITQAKRLMEAQMEIIETSLKELEGIPNQQGVPTLLKKWKYVLKRRKMK
ncbi:hypothetical protein NDU88_001281 [Pleurodeles waltl]|uniref:Uncharacterized protein n=1 Tax=Pleurodeles waltl TaxID=8319 RepID=A0AAV7T030_PLEWA|nr:hypothetical protein NDU88_001281 [Pleurodeles waltl]